MTYPTIVVADCETTGMDPATDLLCEVALVWVQAGPRGHSRVLGSGSSLVRVRRPLDPRARAVHHLSPARLERARPAPTVLLHLWRPDVQAAAFHFASFDAPFFTPQLALARLTLPPVICTYRLALHLWPDAPSHSLQALRYHLGLRARPPAWCHPHRALHDALVAAELLRRVLAGGRSIEDLVRLTTEPVLQAKIRFGQHKDSEWRTVPGSYLRWMRREYTRDPDAFDLDARYTVEAELARRAKPRAAEASHELAPQTSDSVAADQSADGPPHQPV